MTARRLSQFKHAAAYAVAAVVLGAVSLWYLNPALAVDLANRVWSCFG